MSVARRTQRALAAFANKAQDFLNDRMITIAVLDILHTLLERALVGKQQPVSPAQIMDVFARKSTPVEPDDVQA